MKATRFTSNIALALMAVSAAACGAKQKTGLGAGVKPPPPPKVISVGPEKPKRQISKDAKEDYKGALAFFQAQEKAGWSESTCRQAADKFSSVIGEHPKLVEAQYMVGRSYHACKMYKEAEEAYRKALQINPNHGASISNLGDIYFHDGKVSSAKQYWANAIKANPKLSAARSNLATLDLEDMRRTTDPGTWRELEADARSNLSSSLAVDNDNVKTYVIYGLVYMEGRQKNKNRLDLAKLLLDEGAKRSSNFAPLENARGLYFLYRNSLSEALAHFQKAVELDPNFAEARMNVGLTTLGFRKYDTAKAEFQKVLELKPKDYDAIIGLGIAERGLGNLDGAEDSYKKAKSLDPQRGEAYFNLGVLYKDFRAAKQSDVKSSQASYRTARDYFQQFLSKDGSASDKADAKDNIADCDKVIKQLDDFMKSMANQPQPPADGGGAGSGSAAPPPAGGGK